MEKKYRTGILVLFLLLVLPVAIATQPPRLENDELIIPHTTDGTEIANLTTFVTSEGVSLYSREQDPDYEIRFKETNPKSFSIKIYKNPNSTKDKDIPMELCYIGLYPPKMTKEEEATVGTPVNCVGEFSYHTTLKEGSTYTLKFKGGNALFDFFISDGARGGGTIGCVPGWSVISLSTSIYPAGGKNTEVGFQHRANVGLTVGAPGGSCTVTFKHKPAGTYTAYTSAYYTGYQTNSLAKIYTGSTANPITITSGGLYYKSIKCGGRHGTLYLGVTAGTFNSYDTVVCTDADPPTITQITPTNNTVTNLTTSSFRCDATDNTGLKYIDLYNNVSGTWTQVASESYGNLVYSASKTWTGIDIDAGVCGITPYVWECRARDTRSPTNDAYSGKYNLYYNETCAPESTGFVIIDGVLPYFISPLNCRMKEKGFVVYQATSVWQRFLSSGVLW